MTMVKQYRSKALAAIHETMESLHNFGAIDKRTMRDFDDTCLASVKVLSPEMIRALCECEHLSQPLFARYKNLISGWVRGVKRPCEPDCAY